MPSEDPPTKFISFQKVDTINSAADKPGSAPAGTKHSAAQEDRQNHGLATPSFQA
jgi:hypothetical protein